MNFEVFMDEYGYSLIYIVLAFLILLVAKVIKDVLTPFKLDEQLTQKDNPALGLAVTGYFAGVIIVLLGATIGPDPEGDPSVSEILVRIGIDFAYAFGGIVALNIGRLIVDKLVLYKFSTIKEIIEDRNVGTGAVEFGAYVATALIIAGSINGQGGGVLTALGIFAIGQITLIIFSMIYQAVTKYDVHDEIEKDNVAAGVALGGGMVAMGVILLGATSGNFIGWQDSLIQFAYFAIIGFVLLAILRKATDWVLLPGTTLAVEIAKDKNIAAAWIESIVSIGMAVVIFFMFK